MKCEVCGKAAEVRATWTEAGTHRILGTALYCRDCAERDAKIWRKRRP